MNHVPRYASHTVFLAAESAFVLQKVEALCLGQGGGPRDPKKVNAKDVVWPTFHNMPGMMN